MKITVCPYGLRAVGKALRERERESESPYRLRAVGKAQPISRHILH